MPRGRVLSLVILPHPLLTERLTLELEAGRSIAELVDSAGVAFGHSCQFEATINGDLIEKENWVRVRPKAGSCVMLRAVAGFDDIGSVAKTLVSVAGLVVGMFNPIAGAAVTLGGALLVGMLFPPAKPILAPSSEKRAEGSGVSSYSIRAGQNQAQPYGSVPVILGRNRVYPALGALPYTEFVGADQYLRMLFVWGYGPLEISSIKIGETPITDFSDVEIETRYGYPGDAPITLYPNEVVQEDLSIELTAAGGAENRTTATDIDEISVDFVAPAGVLRVDANNAAQTYSVTLRVEYRPAGSLGGYTLLGVITLSGRSRDQIRTGLRSAVPNGQYEVQVTKTSSDYVGAEQVTEDVVWSALRGFRNSPPISFDKPLTVTAIRIRATSQLNGTIDKLNGICASKVKSFTGAGWVPDTTSNQCADLFRHVLQSPANAQPVADDRINLPNLEQWRQFCQVNGFNFNLICDTPTSVYERLKAIAAAGRATVTFTNGKWDVVWDQPDAPIVQHFTPRNSWGFTGGRSYQRTPHGWRVRFINEDAGYEQDERIVYDDGYSAENATLFEAIEFPGVTDSGLIWKHGRFHIAQAKLRPEKSTLNVDFEHLVATRGDRVRITHDVLMVGLASGRVKAVGLDGDEENDTVTLDEYVTMEADKNYAIRFRAADGSSLLRNVITDDGETRVLTLDGRGAVPTATNLFQFGEAGLESVVMRILSLAPGPDLSARITLVDDAPAISMADQGAIPAFDSKITLPVDRFNSAPVDLAVAEAFEGVEGATRNGALFSWSTLAGSAAVSFDIEYRDDDGDNIWRTHGNVLAPLKSAFIPDLLRGFWSFHVRSVFADGTVSRWAVLEHVDVSAGAGLQLPDVQNFVTSYDNSRASLKWDKVKFSKLEVFYEIRKGVDWDTGLTIFPQVADSPVALPGNGTFLIKAKAQPQPGITIYSPDPAVLTVTGAILVRNVLSTLDERANGWTGSIVGPAIVDGEFVRTTAAGEWAYYEIAADRIFDNGYVREIRIESSFRAVGVAADDNFLANPDVLNTADIFSSALTQLIEVRVDIAEALDIDEDVYAGQDVYAAPDVYAGSVVFSDWRVFAPDQYLNRFSKLRFAMRSNDPNVHAALLDWVIVADVPDRLDHYTNLVVPAGGVTVTFTPKGGAVAKPFKGGPDGAPGSDPHSQITILNAVAGDRIEITSAIDLASIGFRILNAGVPVDRVVNLEVQGY